MEALLFFQSTEAEKPFEGETVVIYTMGLTKWIIIPGKDISVGFEGQQHSFLNDCGILQLGTVIFSTPPISPFCIKERYTNVLFQQLDDGFTLTHPNLGRLLFSPHLSSPLLEQQLPQEALAERGLLLEQKEAEKHRREMLPEDQLLQAHPQRPQLQSQQQPLPLPSQQKQKQSQSPLSQHPMTQPLLQVRQRRPLPVLPPQLPLPQPRPYSAHLKPSPSTSGLSAQPPSNSGIKQQHILPSALQVKSLLARPKRQYPALRGQLSLGGLGVPSSGPLAPGTSGQPV